MTRAHRPKAGFWIRLCVLILYPLDALLFGYRWRGLEKIPPPGSGGLIFAINHTSHIDTILMARVAWVSGRIPRFMIKDGLFTVPVVGGILRRTHQIPVHRGSANAANALAAAVDALNAGEAIVIYPEGTITRDPKQWPQQGKTGIARLVLQCPNATVIPIGQWGAQKPKHWTRLLTRRTSTVIVGDPLDLSEYVGREPAGSLLRTITDSIMADITTLVAETRELPVPTS